MPKIINAYAEGQSSIADSLKDIGQSIWGDAAKNEGYRQNAEKLRRENQGRSDAADAFRRGDYTGIGAGGIMGGMSGSDAGAYSRLLAARNSNGNYDDPTLGTMMLGSGEAMSSTPEGQRRALTNQRQMELDRTEAAKFSPVSGEDRYGNKQPIGSFNTRTGEYQPFGAPQAGPGGAPAPQPGFRTAPAAPNTPQAGYQPTAGYTPPATQPTGGDYLQTLPPGQASLIVGILDGRTPPPTGNALLAPRNQRLLEDLALVEPGFDMTKWVERYKTAQDFSSGGKSGQAVKSANQAVTHLGELVGAAEGLHNRSGFASPLLNQIGNATAEFRGQPGAQPFEMARNAFADEIAKVFRTTGMSDHEIAQWHNTINSSMSPEQLRANTAQALRLYHGALDALEQNRSRGMGNFRQQPPLLDPATQQTMNRIDTWTKGGKWEPAPARGPQAAGAQPATALPPGPTGHPPSINDTAPAAPPNAPASFTDRFHGEEPVAPAPAARPRAQNAQGQIVEWNGQQWTPAQ